MGVEVEKKNEEKRETVEVGEWWVERGLVKCVFFFFQAEDGIRDTSVTGVQTCALPI